MADQETLIDSLRQFIDHADEGERLPTVRDMMKTFGVGQATVQDALSALKSEGLVQSHVGRGSFVAKPKSGRGRKSENGAALKSVLILSNVHMNARCTMVQSLVVTELQSRGAKVVQMSYTDTDQLLAILKGIPSFDAVIMQSHYETIPIRLLQALKNKTRALVFDGLTVSGVDLDRVGVDWQEVVGLGLNHLVAKGRRQPALITIDSGAQPMVLTRRFFDRIQYWAGHEISTSVHVLDGIVHPTQNPETALSKMLGELKASGVDSALVLGMSETSGIDAALTSAGLGANDALPIVVLGHHDVASEHLGKYTIAGVSHTEGARRLIDSITERFNNPKAAPRTYFLNARLKSN